MSELPRSENFVHLHNHTEYSMLDGAARIKDMFSTAQEMGMPAIAMTDHGYLFGAHEFWKTAQDYDVKPIIGLEAYVAPGTHRSDKNRVKWGDERTRPGDDVSGGGAYTHMTLLARNNTGMHNLFTMGSRASLDSVFAKWPRLDRELLSQYGEGIIATTGCPSGEIQTRLRLGQYDKAIEAASEFRDIFGREHYFLELMDHGNQIERRVRDDLMRLAKDLQLPLLATNDLHYVKQEDAIAQDALLCINSGSQLHDPDRFKFDGEGYYLKSPAEMRHLWRELPEACDNTLLVADMCEVSFVEGEGRYMPKFDCPPGEDEQSWFVKEVQSGLGRRFPDGIPEYAQKQADYESEVITGKGYCFPGETPVLMADGSWLRIDEVSVGDQVTSISTWNLRPAQGAVERVLTREVEEDLYDVRPHGQSEGISATAEHPFLVAGQGWVEAQHVRPGDEVLLVQPESAPYQPFDMQQLMLDAGWQVVSTPDERVARLGGGEQRAPRPNFGTMPTKVEWSEDLMWLLGLWVAEGHLYDPDGETNPGQVGWTLHRDEPAVARLTNLVQSLGLGRPRVYSKASAARPDHQGVVVMLTNHPLALFLREMFGSGVRSKFVAPWVRSVPRAGLRAFIAGWHEGDGYVDARGHHMVTTVNPTLGRQLRAMLLSLGQWATLVRSPSQRSWKVKWVPDAHKAPYNARNVDGRWWVRVREVSRRAHTGTVYNLTVSGDHTYVANGIAVHNCGYFLVVADFINWAKRNGIRVGPGRGSGAGSMCAYAMGITDLDPIPHGLIFERFLNPERKSMPDFDVDFDERRRSEVIRYVSDKYGDERVAMIATYGTIKAKQAVKDSARVMGHPFNVGEQLTKAMPADVMGKGVPLSKMWDKEHDRFSEGQEFRQLVESEKHLGEVVDLAKGLEGLKRQWGVHAAGVIMSSEPLIDVIPIMRRLQDGQVLTQFDYPTCETLGLVKMDFLGLRNLTILDDALVNIKSNRGEEIDLDALSKDMTDKATYRLLSRGDTLGVFQLDGGGMRTLLRLMQPDNFEDISAALALYRPGPMGVNAHTNFALRKNGRQEVVPLDPQLKGKLQPQMEEALGPILGNTYGLCVAGETPIIDADTGERVRVDELEQRVRDGFFTLGVDDSGQVVRRRVTHWWQMPDKPVLTVHTSSGQKLRLSGDHKVLTPRGWVPAGELVAGVDRIARPRDVHEWAAPSSVTPDEAALLGYLVSDGYITLDENSFINSSPELRAEVVRLSRELFDDTHPVVDCLDRSAPRVRFAASPQGTGNGGNPRRGSYSTIGINRWLRGLGYVERTTSAHKFVPEAVKRASAEARTRMLAALWDGDGHVGPKLAFYTTISHRLAEDVQYLLSTLGIPSRVHHAHSYVSSRDGIRDVWKVHVYDERFWQLVTPVMVHRAKISPRDRLITASRSRGVALEHMLVHAGDIVRSDDDLADRSLATMRVGAATLPALRRHLWRQGLVDSPKTTHPRFDGSGLYPLNETSTAYLSAMGTAEDHFIASFDWVGVDEIVTGSEEPVYDITVEDVHNFVSNGMVLSNCIYQEQVMEIAQKLAGYTLGNADLLRRAMGKKKKEVLDKEYVPFSEGMKANGYNEASIAALWGVLVPFSDYAFNKAHTAAYGLVSYWTAYLKANYPAEYMAALLTSVGDDKDKSALYLNECRRMGIKVLPPSVNESQGPFSAVGSDIRFGLNAIRNVGRNVVDGIIAAREEKGAFTSFDDFLAKCPAVVCNKRTVESLIMGGAFDDLEHPRQGLVMVHEEYVDAFVGVKRQEAVGQDSLWDMFGGDDADDAGPAGIEGMGLRPVPVVEWDKRTKLANEREMLGLYVSDHPLFGVEHVLQRAADTSIAALTQPDSGIKEGSHVTIAGLVTGLSVKRTKKGDLWAIATVEDLEGAIECLFFPKTYLTVQTMLTQDIVAVVRGRVNARDDSVSLYAEDLTIPEITDGPRGPVVLTLDYARATTGRIEEVKQVLAQHPGSTDVQIKLVQPGRSVTMSVDPSYRVEPTEALIGDLKVILGARAVSA
ncbi:DNA polymerase III subunit alpha [Janibacter anophelis]|uniref:DNA polymerase III subunit alpha n=1 Tax=Janibacter anophelis TaxID=319054 RepID=UPI000A5B40F1|nr:DNA polymerase III subunit alpha [Janibacter anophelis]